MKQIINKIISFFARIWKFIDRKIIIPITKLILSISSYFEKSGKKIEEWISKTNNLIFISLAIAFVIFIAIDQKVLTFSESSAEVLKDRVVEAIYNEEAYVIEGLPETVDITLIGRRADILLAKRTASSSIQVDLTGLKPGKHEITLEYNQVFDTIEYKVNPSVATIIIYQKISMVKTLTVDLLNQDSLSDKLVIDDVDIDNDSVVIKGAEKTLEQVASVKALVNIEDLVSTEVGTTTLNDIPLKAYDEDGNIVDVEIVPSKINATITITSPSKEVPIKIIPTGDLSFGSAISEINSSVTKVTVYGEASAIEDLTYLPVEIDVTDLSANKQFIQEIEMPSGVKSMSVNSVTVDVTVGISVDRTIDNVKVDNLNLADGYAAQGLTEDDVQVSVVLKGVESVVNDISAEDITAYLDLSGYTEGEYEVEVNVSGTDVRVDYVSKTKKVKIKIYKK
ncbi:MAG: CdaR family protein [Bacilli bacterium]|nr:CdaR family protein [Bacilli bacterium]